MAAKMPTPTNVDGGAAADVTSMGPKDMAFFLCGKTPGKTKWKNELATFLIQNELDQDTLDPYLDGEGSEQANLKKHLEENFDDIPAIVAKRIPFMAKKLKGLREATDVDGLTTNFGDLDIQGQLERVQNVQVETFKNLKDGSILVGTDDFMEVVKSGFYVDKTQYALIFLDRCRAALLRPPRMGKTLFVSMLVALFDKAYKKVFPSLFEGLYVATHAKPHEQEQFHTFHVLRVTLPFASSNFGEAMRNAIVGGLIDFFKRHPDVKRAVKDALEGKSWLEEAPDVVLDMLASHLRHTLMILADEIDRAIMEDGCGGGDNNGSSSGGDNGDDGGGGSGSGIGGGGGGGGGVDRGYLAGGSRSPRTPLSCVKAFLYHLKQLGSFGARYYVTGIFPVQTGSSIFNAKHDLTHSKDMADAFGLKEVDVVQLLGKFAPPDADRGEILEHMRRDSNGLHPFNSTEALFNPQLVQVAVRQLQDTGKLTSTLTDDNQLLTRRQLTEALRSKETTVQLLSAQPFTGEVNKSVDPTAPMDTPTHLYYLGVVSPCESVTVDADGTLSAELQIPNRATRKQFVSEFIKRTQGKLGGARRFLRDPSVEALRAFVRGIDRRWTSRQTEDDLKMHFCAAILHFSQYTPAVEHSYGGGRTDISAVVRNDDGTVTLIIVELKTLGVSRTSQSLLLRASKPFGFEWDTTQEFEYSDTARTKMDEMAPNETDLLALGVTYSNSGVSYKTVGAVHTSAITQARMYKANAIRLQQFDTVVAFAVTQVAHRFVVSREVGEPASGGASGACGGKKKKKKKKKKK